MIALFSHISNKYRVVIEKEDANGCESFIENTKKKVPMGYTLDNEFDLKVEIDFLLLGKYMDYYIDYLAEKHTGGDIKVLRRHFDAEGVRKAMMSEAFGEVAENILDGQSSMPKVAVQDLFYDVHEPVNFDDFKTIKTNEFKLTSKIT